MRNNEHTWALWFSSLEGVQSQSTASFAIQAGGHDIAHRNLRISLSSTLICTYAENGLNLGTPRISIICRVYWLHWFHVLHTVLCQVNANHPRTSARHFWTTAGPRASQTTRPHFQASKERTQGDEELGSILVPINIARWNCNLSQKRFDLDLKTLDRNASLLCRLQPFNMATKPRSAVLTDLVHCNIFPWKIMMILCTTNAIWEDNFFQTGRLKAAFSSAHNFRRTLYGLTVIDVSVRLWIPL